MMEFELFFLKIMCYRRLPPVQINFPKSALGSPQLQHLNWNTINLILNSLFSLNQSSVVYTLLLKRNPTWKTTPNRSNLAVWGASQRTLPNNSSTASNDCCAVCDVTPSCWNQDPQTSGKWFNSGAKKDPPSPRCALARCCLFQWTVLTELLTEYLHFIDLVFLMIFSLHEIIFFFNNRITLSD